MLSFRTLLTNPKVFQTQANQNVNFRNLIFVGAVWPRISTPTPIESRRAIITNPEKNPGVIVWPNLSRFGFCRCDFQHYLLITYGRTDYLLITYLLTCWFSPGGDSLWKPAKAGTMAKISSISVIQKHNYILSKSHSAQPSLNFFSRIGAVCVCICIYAYTQGMCICGFVRKKCVYAVLCICGLERFLGCVYAVLQENNISLLDYIMPGSIRNERK